MFAAGGPDFAASASVHRSRDIPRLLSRSPRGATWFQRGQATGTKRRSGRSPPHRRTAR